MELAGHVVDESSESEEALALKGWHQGNAQAFGVIVRRYMKQAYFTALGLVGNHEDALDLSQEAFVRAFKARERFDLRQRFFTWYYKILRNLCLNHLRDRGRFTELGTDFGTGDSPEMPATQADPSVLAERNELNEQLWNALSRLRPGEREVLILREMEDCSYAEIAQRLDIPSGTVMSRLYYARKRLKELLQESL